MQVVVPLGALLVHLPGEYQLLQLRDLPRRQLFLLVCLAHLVHPRPQQRLIPHLRARPNLKYPITTFIRFSTLHLVHPRPQQRSIPHLRRKDLLGDFAYIPKPGMFLFQTVCLFPTLYLQHFIDLLASPCRFATTRVCNSSQHSLSHARHVLAKVHLLRHYSGCICVAPGLQLLVHGVKLSIIRPFLCLGKRRHVLLHVYLIIRSSCPPNTWPCPVLAMHMEVVMLAGLF